jgi:putative hemolysin
LSASTAIVLNAIGIKEQTEPQVTEAEIQVLVAQATVAGVFEEAEQDMIASVLKLGDTKVTSLMTPRTNIVWLDAAATQSELISVLETSQHARFPVGDGTLDKMVGIVETKQIMRSNLKGETIDLRALAFQPSFVPETKTGLQLLESFRDAQQDVAIVLDEYGGIQGLVTRDDIFQSIVGELPTAGEQRRWEAHKSDDGSWFIDGQMPISEFRELLDIGKLPGEDDSEYHTLAGFVIYQLKHVPETGEHFVWEKLRFEVVDMDRHRIDKIRVTRLQKV